MKRFSRIAALCTMAALAAPSAAAQQAPTASCASCRFGITAIAGVSQYDLSGTGTTSLVGAHLDRGIRPWLMADVGLRVLHPDEQFRGRSWYAIPELQLQVQPSHGVLRPYLGAGGGWFIGTRRNGTVSGAVGLRYVTDVIPFGARAELRVRGIGRSFGGATAEWTLGVTYHVRRGGV